MTDELNETTTEGWKSPYAFISTVDGPMCAWCGILEKYIENTPLHIERHSEVDRRLEKLENLIFPE